jgi:hypothetical protein
MSKIDMRDMNTKIPVEVGSPFAGGFYAGRIRIDGQLYALIVSPKAEGDHATAEWIEDEKDVPGATSYYDGLRNTNAMADAGSELAKWARDLRIGGFDEWYLPSLDELEVIYRNLKPTTRKNYCWVRAGINLNAEVPAVPYTSDHPVQTAVTSFQEGGAEAFDTAWYWTSTRYIDDHEYAWYQHFSFGDQGYGYTHDCLRARAVRRLAI